MESVLTRADFHYFNSNLLHLFNGMGAESKPYGLPSVLRRDGQ